MPNAECRMSNLDAGNAGSDGKRRASGHTYDLEERTANFSERVIAFALEIERNPVTFPLISQLVDAATSIGANYCEADDAESKKDFRHKIGLCREEARETKYWFRLIARASPNSKPAARPLWTEAQELHLIFSKIRRSCDKDKDSDNSKE
jgi:four helix bundle protein